MSDINKLIRQNFTKENEINKKNVLKNYNNNNLHSAESQKKAKEHFAEK